MNDIERQIKIAFVESDFMFGTLVNSQRSPFLTNGVRDDVEAYNLTHLLFYSYHYIYDLKSISEILKHNKSRDLIAFKNQIEEFLGSELACLVDKVKNHQIHHKMNTLLTVSYCNDDFTEKYLFCDMPVFLINDGYPNEYKGFKIPFTTKDELLSSTKILRINLNAKGVNEYFSVRGFYRWIIGLRAYYHTFLTSGLSIEMPAYDKSNFDRVSID